MSITLQPEGRRTYITGNTYPHRDAIRGIGAKWDADRKAWWTGKRAEAEALVAKLGAAQPAPAAESQPQREAPGDDATVAGRVAYKLKTYYLAGRIERGRAKWDVSVHPVQSRDGAKVLLYSRDGSLQFWASRSQVTVTKTYDMPQTIGGLHRYAERAKQAGGDPLEEGYYYGAGWEVLASGCAQCRRLGRMCASCERDFE